MLMIIFFLEFELKIIGNIQNAKVTNIMKISKYYI